MRAQQDTVARVIQPALAATLRRIGRDGARFFYDGPLASAIEQAVAAHGGALTAYDMARHATVVVRPLTMDWGPCRVHLQPPMSQGALLGMVLNALARTEPPKDALDHVALELTLAAFAFRKDIARGASLLQEPLKIDPERASGRRGPRSYLHTAGVAVADDDGMVVSSLLSVFDDFGSAIYVPDGGFVLNNRALGFTDPPNEPGPDKFPVHTLAPIMIETDTCCFGLATPGADGQVQTLLQIMLGCYQRGRDLAAAIDALRWRSEDGRLLMEEGHPGFADLQQRGHDVVLLPAGDIRFGGVVCAGLVRDAPFAIADWRRENWSAIV
jgi:gamma-glutamyltranspeptidase / glutathione hydrolase